MELSDQTKKNLELSRKEIERGEYSTLEEIKRELEIIE